MMTSASLSRVWVALLSVGLAVDLLPAPSRAATLAENLQALTWLSGVWRGHNGMDEVEEVYGPLSNEEMLATFKAVTHGKVSRYELRSLRAEGGQIVFEEIAGPTLKATVPVPTRTLLSTDPTHLRFNGLILTRVGENQMLVAVTLNAPNSEPRTVEFTLNRVLQLAPKL